MKSATAPAPGVLEIPQLTYIIEPKLQSRDGWSPRARSSIRQVRRRPPRAAETCVITGTIADPFRGEEKLDGRRDQI